MAQSITATEAAELLSYDPGSGEFRWRVNRCRARAGGLVGSWDLHGYKTVRLNGGSYKLHRLAWLMTHGTWPSGDVDHLNGIRHDNRISNLRDVPRGTNLQNRRAANPNKPSGLPLGVHCNKGASYEAKISVGNKSRVVGRFATPEEASAAYVEAKRKLHAGGLL